jgi:serine/threonine protein kinase
MRLGDFEVLREIGRGGMGVVYEARQVSLNRKVALKVLSAGLGLSVQGAQRFRREAEAAARLHHSNIVPVYATGEQDGTLYYAMELIEGPSLYRLIRQMRQGHGAPAAGESQAPAPDPEQTGPYVAGGSKTSELLTAASSSEFGSDSHYFDAVARAVAEVADALEYAHKNGVIHRDVKPSNLLVSPDGRLSLTDFGLARVLEQPGMTLSGEFVGTPRYMSPEQIAAGRTPLDRRTDVYSLGATLYELLTLRPPFPGERREQVLAQVLHKEPTPPRRVNRRVPVDLETICLKALEKDPDRRYQTAGQLAEDLPRYVNRFAIQARRAGPVERLKKWVKRHPGLAAGLACALLAIGSTADFAAQAHRSEQRRQAERDQQAQELAQQKRQSALEKALLLAMGGDLLEAEKAIGEAEVLGASTGQVRMLRGQVALHRGQAREAVTHLERAVELMPGSVAARAMLLVAYMYVGRTEKCLALHLEIQRLSSKTPEDRLFKSYANSQSGDLEHAINALDEMIREHPSTLARLIRADVLGNRAMETGTPADVERVLEEANAIRQALPDNAMALWVSLQAHLVAAAAYEESGQPAKSQKAIVQAGRDADNLKRFGMLPTAVIGRFCYFQQIGRQGVRGGTPSL